MSSNPPGSRGRGYRGARPKEPASKELTESSSRPGPPSAPSKALPKPMPTPRGRKTIVTAPGPSQPVEQVTRCLAATSIQEGGGESSRGAGERSRGSCRTRPLELVTRPPNLATKQGSGGRSVVLKGNYFGFQSLTDWSLYQYRVDFNPDEERTAVRKGLLKPHKDTFGPYIFDGTVLYTTTKLKSDPLELVSNRLSDDSIVVITVKKTADCVMGDYNYLQVLNIIARKALAGLHLQLIGRDYFDPHSKVEIKNFNLEIWPGYVTSIRQFEKSILLNVDVSSKVMRLETAYNLLITSREQAQHQWKEVFEAGIIGMTVITRYNNKTYRVDDVDYNSSPRSEFDMKGTNVTYVDYYNQKYQIKIRNMEQPLLVSRPKAKDVRGGRDQNVVLVPELCCLTGLTDSMRSNFNLMKAVAEYTRIPPNARMERLERGFMGRISSTKEVQDELRLWNMKFTPSLIQFPGRCLQLEKITLARGVTVTGDMSADFSRKLVGNAMLDCTEIRTWVCIYPRRVSKDIQMFCSGLSKAANSLQFRIPGPKPYEIPDDRILTYVNAIESCVNEYNPTFVLCVMINNKADRYEAIKKKCYVDRAIPNQVVLAKNLTKGLSVATKIAIQINCKLGGTPWVLHIPFKSHVMVVGFDVTHDTKSKGKSVGALVASLNSSFSRYFSAVSVHTNGEELSNDIAIQMTKAVVKYRSINNAIPDKIIFYRDGVGDGNIHYVLTHEIKLIKDALKEYYPSNGPPMAFVIVTKKVNTRIFSPDGNPCPGTIVDDTITFPERYDFFLISQSVKQGTVSPTYYNVIYDTAGYTADVIQQLSYKLTHLYYNVAGTVRVPAPCQYAHKLAFLIGQSLHRMPNNAFDDLLYFL